MTTDEKGEEIAKKIEQMSFALQDANQEIENLRASLAAANAKIDKMEKVMEAAEAVSAADAKHPWPDDARSPLLGALSNLTMALAALEKE